MKILVTGASGLLGWNLASSAEERHDVLGTFLHHRPPLKQAAGIDLTARHAVATLFNEFRPHLVVHTAALTRADLCERDPGAARALNVEAAGRLAQLCEKHGARMIHISTDLVFDGKKGMYREQDEPAPLSCYGETKLLAESEIARTLENHTILRVSLMYGKSLNGRRGADEAIIAAVKEGRTLHLFTDEYRTPVCVPRVVEVILKMADFDAPGLFHCAGDERLSRHEFAQRLAKFFPLDMKRIVPSKIADIPIVPPRAPDVSLDASRLREGLGLSLLNVEQGLSLLHKQ